MFQTEGTQGAPEAGMDAASRPQAGDLAVYPSERSRDVGLHHLCSRPQCRGAGEQRGNRAIVTEMLGTIRECIELVLWCEGNAILNGDSCVCPSGSKDVVIGHEEAIAAIGP